MAQQTASDRDSTFIDDLQAALQALRSALMEIFAAVDADPAKPQDLARRFGLNKNLTWKLSKIVVGTDPFGAVPHIPGASGMDIFFRALVDAGAPKPLLERARAAARAFEQTVRLHTGDRSTLEIMVGDRLPTDIRREQSELHRKRAFQGNSGIWGVRAKAQLLLTAMAPNAADPDMADLVQVGGVVGFRRLKADARWLLFRRERWADDDPHPERDELESLDPDFPVDQGVPLIGAFCSRPLPDIELISDEGEDQYELPPGPIGNTAALTCVHGQVARRVGPVYAESESEYSELGCTLITPAEHLVFDLLVHRDLDWAMQPELVVYSRMDGGAMHPAARRERNEIPVSEPVHDLGWGITALATTLLPKYLDLARFVFDSVAWNADDFRAFRVTMAYPPIPSVALLRSRMPLRG